jgi:hypothetical protein
MVKDRKIGAMFKWQKEKLSFGEGMKNSLD